MTSKGLCIQSSLDTVKVQPKLYLPRGLVIYLIKEKIKYLAAEISLIKIWLLPLGSAVFLIYYFITYSVTSKQCSGSEETFLSIQTVQLSHSFKVVLFVCVDPFSNMTWSPFFRGEIKRKKPLGRHFLSIHWATLFFRSPFYFSLLACPYKFWDPYLIRCLLVLYLP